MNLISTLPGAPSRKDLFRKGSSFLTIIAVAVFALATINTRAQTPAIIKNISIPSGNANCTGVAYGGGKYVAILSGGYIYQSANGQTWSKVVDAGIPAGTFNSISYGAGYFVVAGNGGMIISSANGVNWTSRTSSTTQNLTNVQFLQGAFYVTGMNTTLRRSTDGISFSSITIGAGTATDMFLSITYGAGTFVITARNSGGTGMYAYKSATGLSASWSFQDLGFGSVNRIQYINDRFFVFQAGHKVITSTNASTWTDVTASITLTLPNATSGTWNSSNQIFNGFYDGSKYYFFGSSQYYSGYGSVWTATTGLNFTLLTKTAYIVPQNSAFLNGIYFQTGNEGLVYSTDGATFKYPTGSYNAAATSGTSYAAVGIVGSNNGSIFSSTDFNTWTERTPLNQQELYAVVYNGSKYLAVGNYTVVESVDNGTSWNQVATPSATYTTLAWGNSKFVAGGYDGVGAKIWYSADGSSWTTASTADNYYFRIKYVNGNFFAMGMDNTNYLGVIMQSADGITWNNITPTLPFSVYYFHDVVFDGTKYHFMGSENGTNTFFAVSTATINNPNSFANKGTITSPPGGSQLGGDWGQGAFGYSNGHFVGSVTDIANGYIAYVVYSNDGVTWTASSIDETTAITAAITEGDVFRLIGTGDGKVTVTYSLMPVSGLQFNGTINNGQSQLFWKTYTETNTADFELQHSTDGSSWTTIHSTAAAGTSVTAKEYAYTHNTPAKGLNYYRIKQNDINGRYSFSSIIKLLYRSENDAVLVYPNPVTRQQLNIQLATATTVKIYNSNGALVYSQNLPAGAQQVNTAGFAKGTYVLKAGGKTSQLVIQ